MPRKAKKIDYAALLKMIEEQVTQKEIMEKFDFKTITQLKTSYANALMETGKAPKLIGKSKGLKPEKIDRAVSVNKRGTLIIPKQVIEYLGLAEGETFEIRKSKAGLSLKKV